MSADDKSGEDSEGLNEDRLRDELKKEEEKLIRENQRNFFKEEEEVKEEIEDSEDEFKKEVDKIWKDAEKEIDKQAKKQRKADKRQDEQLEDIRNSLVKKSGQGGRTSGGSGGFSKDSMRKHVDEHGHKYGIGFFLLLHFMIILGFSSGYAGNTVLISAAILLILSTLWVYLKTQEPVVIAMAASELVVPYVLDYFQGSGFVMSLLLTLWIFTPAMSIYLSYYADSSFYRIWAIVWVFVLAFLLIDGAILTPFFPEVAGSLDPLNAMEEFWDVVSNSISNTWDKIWVGLGAVPEAGRSALDYATGGYYTGIVEDQQGEPVGLYIEEMRVPSDIYFEGDPVYLWADIRGKSFKETIDVQTACSASGDDRTYTGNTTPSSFEVFYEQFESVQCRLGGLEEGDYRATFTAGFNFHTWSYVTYTFVDQQTRINYQAQGKDINDDLDIEKSLKPVYTPGPVALGMSSDIPQPVGIRMDEERPLNVLFGVTLENLWTEGDIARVREFDIMVPEQFQLLNCDSPVEPEVLQEDPFCAEDPSVCARDMKVYRFEGLNTPGRFTTVNCRMHLAEGVDPEEVVEFGQSKAQKTFVVKAKYDYVLEDSERIEVEGYNEN